MKKYLFPIAVLSVFLMQPPLLFSQPVTEVPLFDLSRFEFSGQLRPSFTHIDSRSNSDNLSSRTELQFRGRFITNYTFSNRLKLNTRFVLKLSTDQDTFSFWPYPYLPSSSGLKRGQFTYDIFNFAWSVNDRLYTEIGRMQHTFQLRGLIPKAFDRYHSPNLSSAWSDGLLLRWSVSDQWNVYTIFQYNHPRGSGSLFSSPLSFKESGARISYFAAIERAGSGGLWKQRSISGTLIPKSIVNNNNNNHTDYVLFSGRLVVALPMHISWMNISVGSELAYAPNTPDPAQFKLPEGTSGTDGALGFQAALNFEQIFEKSNLSFLYGYSEPGMLITPSYRSNGDTWEVRYQYRFTPKVSTEIRYRIRNQIHKPVGANVLRLDKDLYARLTIRI